MTERARLAAAVAAQPERADLVLALAQAHAREGNWKAGLALLQQAALLHPTNRELAAERVAILFRARRMGLAAKEATTVLRAMPDHARVWRLAAQVFTAMGNPGLALQAWQSSLQHAPNHAWAWTNLGNLLLARGRLAEAAGALRKALEHGGDNAVVLGNLGAALLHLGRFGAAQARLSQAVALDPQLVSAHVGLAQCRSTLGDEDGAREMFQRALAIAPGRVRTRMAFGDFLVGCGRPLEAEAHYLAVLAQSPDHRRAQLGLGMIRSRQGQHAEAVSMLQGRVDAPDVAVAPVAAFARSCVRVGRATEALEVLKKRAEGPLTPSQAQELHHTLGVVHEALGHHQAAFAAHTAGNRHRERSVDPRAVVREVAEVSALLAAPVPARDGPGAGMVFIVGMPRSGTSLTEQILARHPQVTAGGELPSLTAVLRAPGESPVGAEWAQRLAASGPADWDALGAAYLRDACARAGIAPEDLAGGRLLTDKQPTNFLMLGGIARILPGARIVHCIRDPLDTSLSCYFQNFGPGHAWTTELEWIAPIYRAYRAQMDWWTSTAGIEVVPMRYERLVDDLQGEVRRLLAALDLPFHEDCLSFHQSHRDARTASVDQVRRPIYRSSLGRAAHYRTWLGPLIAGLGDLDALPSAPALASGPTNP